MAETKWITGSCLQSDKHRFRDLAFSHKILGKVTSKGAAPLQYIQDPGCI